LGQSPRRSALRETLPGTYKVSEGVYELGGNQRQAINQYFKTVAEDGDLAALWFRGIYDFDSIKGADLMRFSSLMDYLFRIHEDMYYQHLEGQLDDRVWEAFERIMRDINSYPGIQAWWRTRSHWFRPAVRSIHRQAPGRGRSSFLIW
jgi:hypothetical protein